MLRYLLFTAFMSLTFLSAQIPDGSIAPAWTATDIYGQEHSLYEYLNQGKTVFIEVSATWAAPNYSYHTSGALQDLYIDYGPAGSDELMVFMYEVDASTTLENILGQGSNTVGNWSNVPFPIINDEQIMAPYQIAYFPTVFAICPNGEITEVGQVGAAQLYAHVATCPSLGPLNAAITSYLGSEQACPNQLYHPSVMIQNQNGYNQDLSEVLVETRVNSVLHESQLWTGQLSQGSSTLVDIAPIAVGESDFVVEVTIDYSPDEDDTDNLISESVSIADASSSDDFQLQIQLDQFPAETKWELRNSIGEIVFQDGPFAGQENEFLTDFFVLPYNDCFEFKMLDGGGNGLHASGLGDFSDGYFELRDEFGEIILSAGGSQEWGTEGISRTIFLDMASEIKDEEELSFSVLGNPGSNQLTISLSDFTSESTVRILDMQGKLLKSSFHPAGESQLVVPIQKLSDGSYLIQLIQDEKAGVARFVKSG